MARKGTQGGISFPPRQGVEFPSHLQSFQVLGWGPKSTEQRSQRSLDLEPLSWPGGEGAGEVPPAMGQIGTGR
jgi:hypothetical protein